MTQIYMHTHTHTHIRQDSFERVISSSLRLLSTKHTTKERDEYASPQWDSSPRCQYSSGGRSIRIGRVFYNYVKYKNVLESSSPIGLKYFKIEGIWVHYTEVYVLIFKK